MTIQFNCPNCNSIIAFADKHSGKRARCTTCGQLLIIPSKSSEKPKKVKLTKEKGQPIPGFYHAVFVDNWKLFFNSENATSLVFVIAVICFKFFLGKGICCTSYISFIVVWGWLLGFYLNIIYETAFDIDKLPEIYLGTFVTFVWYIIKPFFLFFITMAVVQLPLIITLALLKDKGFSYQNIWDEHTGSHLLLQGLMLFGLFLFPIAVLTTAVGRAFSMFRPDYLLGPVFKAFVPYVITVALLTAAAILETQTNQYDADAGLALIAGHLMLNLAVQVIAIIAMRSIGLFRRHYSCHFAW